MARPFTDVVLHVLTEFSSGPHRDKREHEKEVQVELDAIVEDYEIVAVEHSMAVKEYERYASTFIIYRIYD